MRAGVQKGDRIIKVGLWKEPLSFCDLPFRFNHKTFFKRTIQLYHKHFPCNSTTISNGDTTSVEDMLGWEMPLHVHVSGSLVCNVPL